MPALAPAYGGENRYYNSADEFDEAVAKAMNVEYRAIVDAGFVVQIDDPGLPSYWDRYVPAISLEEYRKQAQRRVELVNLGLEGIPEDRIRYHICWGSWHGPHVTDIPLEDVVDLMLQVRAQMYSIEAANARHEHEWRVWEDTKLPDGKILMPGVVGHATNVIEHPRLVADRLIRVRKPRRSRKRRRRHRLRPRRPRPPPNLLGQARSPLRRRRPGLEGTVAINCTWPAGNVLTASLLIKVAEEAARSQVESPPTPKAGFLAALT